jgi:hypothetical protein
MTQKITAKSIFIEDFNKAKLRASIGTSDEREGFKKVYGEAVNALNSYMNEKKKGLYADPVATMEYAMIVNFNFAFKNFVPTKNLTTNYIDMIKLVEGPDEAKKCIAPSNSIHWDRLHAASKTLPMDEDLCTLHLKALVKEIPELKYVAALMLTNSCLQPDGNRLIPVIDPEGNITKVIDEGNVLVESNKIQASLRAFGGISQEHTTLDFKNSEDVSAVIKRAILPRKIKIA